LDEQRRCVCRPRRGRKSSVQHPSSGFRSAKCKDLVCDLVLPLLDLEQVLIERLPVQTMCGFSTGTQQIIQISKSLRDSGQHNWLVKMIIRLFAVFDSQITRWRHLEAALAALGTHAESILDCIQDEQNSGRERPLDIENLLVNIVPSILGLPGGYWRHCCYWCR